jgi:hypothetical protein
MKTSFAISVLVLAIGVAGCQKKVEAPKDLEAAFDTKKVTEAAATGAPEVQVMVKGAVTALESKDEVAAVMTLRQVRQSTNLTDAQDRAVNDMMNKVYIDLSERAARGDQKAAMQLQMLNMNQR